MLYCSTEMQLKSPPPSQLVKYVYNTASKLEVRMEGLLDGAGGGDIDDGEGLRVCACVCECVCV